tara:strand:- start:20607 stop:21473 length:867 start_codon:yes stop_codon:yes gene_type:complete
MIEIIQTLDAKEKELKDCAGDIHTLRYSFEVFLNNLKSIGIDANVTADFSTAIGVELVLPARLKALLQEGAVSDDSAIHDVSTAVLFRNQNDVPAPVADVARAITAQQPAIDGLEEASGRSEAPLPPTAVRETVTGPFSKDEFATLIDLSSRGASVKEIALALHRDPKSVQNKLNRHRAKLQAVKKKPRASAKKSEPQQSKVAVQNDTIADLVVTATWTPKLDLKLARLMAKGTGAAGAAAVLRLQKEHVHARWREIKDWVGEPIQSNDDIVAALQERLATLDHTLST